MTFNEWWSGENLRGRNTRGSHWALGAWLASRNEALEEAAKICDERAKEVWTLSLEESEQGYKAMIEMHESEECAEAIRKLKSEDKS